MNKERWEKVELLFEEALKQDEIDRVNFLKKECGEDTELFNEVFSLLNEDSNIHSIFSKDISKEFFNQDNFEKKDSVIGAYRIISKIASGGMGDVFLAERADGEFEQKVALKLIRPGSSSSDIIERFKSERQILAKLQHPNIAQLLDGGITDEGLPFFTMEYVDGVSIDEYCDKNKLSIKQRLKLFSNVCSAVQFAHQNLIIHRDLKPSNILITESGQVKLLDFGIAKVFAENSEDAGLTKTGLFVMTPEYASPEQIRSGTITTATDVYSLGLILYKLLTGSFPYEIKNFTPLELEKSICLTEAEKPSTLISKKLKTRKKEGDNSSEIFITRNIEPEKLKKRLSGDLDNICLLALRKEPEQRYVSAEQLKSDIEKYLNGLPVSAHPPTIKYRSQKFISRHKIAISTAAIITVLITVLTTFYFLQLKQERDKARFEAEKSAKVSEFLIDIFKVSNPSESRGETVTARELLEKGAEKIETELSNQPLVKATLLKIMGNVYSTLGLYDEAKNLVEKSLNIQKQIEPNSIETAGIYNSLANIHILSGEYNQAEIMLKNSEDILNSSEFVQTIVYANMLQYSGTLFGLIGNYEKSNSYQISAINVLKKLPKHKESLLTSMNNLALLKHEHGKYEEAEELFKETYALQKELYENQPHPELATTTYNYAQLLRDIGNYNEAEIMFRNSLEMDIKLHNGEHPEVAYSLQGLASIYRQKGNYSESLKLYMKALEMRKNFLGEEHPDVAYSTKNIARLKYESGDLDGAEKDFYESLKIHKKLNGENHPIIAKTLENLGEIYYDKGDYKKAEQFLNDAKEILLKNESEISLDYALTLLNLAQIYVVKKEYDKAIETGKESLTISEKVIGTKISPFYGGALYFVGEYYDNAGLYVKADSLYKESIEIHKKLYGDNHIRYAASIIEYGRHKLLINKLNEAENLLKNGLNILDKNLSEKSPKYAYAESLLGEVYLKQKKYNEAEKYLTESYKFLNKSYGKKNLITQKALKNLILLYENSGRKDLARDYK